MSKSILRMSAVLAILPASLAAQDNQAWTAIALNGPVTEDSRVLYWFDAHARYRDDAERLGTSIVRPGIGYKLNDRVSLWGGYARVTSPLDNNTSNEEDRLWQQATYRIASVGNGTISGRTRVEQRFVDNDDDTGYRVRQFFRYGHPIGETRFSAVLWDEVFIGFNETEGGQQSGFQQNRAFAGVAATLGTKSRLEVGYLNNHIEGADNSDATNHNVSISLFSRF